MTRVSQPTELNSAPPLMRPSRPHWGVGAWRSALLWSFLGVLVAFAGVAPADPGGNDTVEELLQRADAVRSADPRAFESILAQLEPLLAVNASPPQRRHFQLLSAYHQAYRGSYAKAVEEAADLFERAPEPTLKFRAGLLITNSAAALRDFPTGLRYLERTLALSDQITDPDLHSVSYVVAAVFYNQFGQFSLAKEYSARVLDGNPSPRNRCIANQLRAEATWGLGEGLPRELGIDDAISDCQAQGEAIATNLLRGYQARSLARHGQVFQAIALLEAHIAEIERTRYPHLISEIHALLAEYRLEAGDLAMAEGDANKAVEASGGNAFSQPRVAAYRVLYEAAKRRGDTEAALTHLQHYQEADKAYLTDVQARELAFQQSRNELQQKNQDIALLSKRNDVLRLEQVVAKKSAQNTRLALAMLAVVLASLGYWAYKVKRVQLSFRRLAECDGLTGISNRRHFRTQVERVLPQCSARGQPVGMLLFDMDYFKTVNDRFGHAIGDWVLVEVVKACRTVCRKGDLFGRLGGEEFAMALIDCDLATTEQIALKCRDRISGIDTGPSGFTFPITASFGCTGTAASGYDFEKLLLNADLAMYRAKHSGRDRVSIAGVEPCGTADTVSA